MRDPILLFLHIPATVGTVFWPVLHRLYRGQLVRVLEEDTERNWATVRHILADPANPYKLIGGHIVFSLTDDIEPPVRYFTMLREPADRAISNYFRIMRDPKNPHHEQFHEKNVRLQDGLRIMRPNDQTYYLAGMTSDREPTVADLERAKQHIVKHIDIVGLTERFSESLILMKKRFGWSMPYYGNRNVESNRTSEIPEDIYELARELNRLDEALYAFVAERFAQEIERQGFSFRRNVWRLYVVSGIVRRRFRL